VNCSLSFIHELFLGGDIMKWDGHTHTPFCPHGSNDSMEAYIEAAIAQGFNRISITEHAPLPTGFIDPVPLQDSAMKISDLTSYFDKCKTLKRYFASKIEIMIGLEIDYLAGYEEETKALLQEIGPILDDAILSVHFLQVNEQWVCLDYLPEIFEASLIKPLGTIEQVYRTYYQTVLAAVEADLGPWKPRRIGHLSLVEKFKKKFPRPAQDLWLPLAKQILEVIKQKAYQLDFNTAGLKKPYCNDLYPSRELYLIGRALGIPFVYGSDAHTAKDIGYAYDYFEANK